jgi:uncharacterized membrane protein HdeD (DUF308 family)
MRELCHRCGSALSDESERTPFCFHCGAPQLYLQEQDRVDSSGEPSTTGALPPPNPQQVEWKTAIRCAALVAGIAALLSLIAARVPVLSPLSTLWILSGALTTLSLYQRQRPLAWMDAGVGARIGAVAGLAVMTFVISAMTIAGLVARFVLHRMGTFDAELAQQLQAQIAHAAASNPIPPDILHYFSTPEFRAGMMIAGVGMMAGFILILSTIAGAVGGLMRMRRQTHA